MVSIIRYDPEGLATDSFYLTLTLTQVPPKMSQEPASKKVKSENTGGLLSKKFRADSVDTLPTYDTCTKGLRKVAPYDYVFSAYAKGRWLKRTILEVFSSEFNYFRSSIFYEHAIKSGIVTVNGKIVDCEYILENSDLVETRNHRHEPPVSSEKIIVVFEDEDMLVVSKPCSYPMHPTGKYRHNTLLHVLKYEMGYNQQLHLVNRIDRLTSGLCLIAKTKGKAATLGEMMRQRNIKKTYLARVRGKFPSDITECHEPIFTLSHKVGVNIVAPEGKPCSTKFTFLSYNGLTSLVKCEPLTGRTHQIRVHLQFLGYPIANDPQYGGSHAWGENLGKGGIDQENRDQLLERFSNSVFPDVNGVAYDENYKGCVDCRNNRIDPSPEQLSLWLHSIKYEGEGWMYETPLPDWATEDWKGDYEIKIKERFWDQGGHWDGIATGSYIVSENNFL